VVLLLLKESLFMFRFSSERLSYFSLLYLKDVNSFSSLTEVNIFYIESGYELELNFLSYFLMSFCEFFFFLTFSFLIVSVTFFLRFKLFLQHFSSLSLMSRISPSGSLSEALSSKIAFLSSFYFYSIFSSTFKELSRSYSFENPRIF